MITPIHNNIRTCNPYFKGIARVYEVKPSYDKISDEMFQEYMAQLDEKNSQSKVEKKYIAEQKETFERNSEETKRVLGLLYGEMKDVCKRERKQEKPKIEWRPSMNSYEADKFVENSELKSTFYRTSISPRHHIKNGFSLGDVDMHYPGIYFAETQEEAQMRNGLPLSVKIKAENIQNYNTFLKKEKEIIKKETRSPEVKEAFYSTIGVLGNVLAKKFNIDVYKDTREYMGGLKQVTSYCVVDPKNVVVTNW